MLLKRLDADLRAFLKLRGLRDKDLTESTIMKTVWGEVIPDLI